MSIIRIVTCTVSYTIKNMTTKILKETGNANLIYKKTITSSTINKGCRFLYNKIPAIKYIIDISLLTSVKDITKLFEILKRAPKSGIQYYIIYTYKQITLDGNTVECLKHPKLSKHSPNYNEIKQTIKQSIKGITNDKLEKLANKLTGLRTESIHQILTHLKTTKENNKEHLNKLLSLFPVSEIKQTSLLLPSITNKQMAGYNGVISKIISSIQSKNSKCKGVLLEGPPGTGKTLLTQRIAFELNRKLLYQKSSQLLSCYLGESEERLRALFTEAKNLAPSILFFDEVDSLLTNRFDGSEINNFEKRLLATFLTEIDSVRETEDVLIFSATNRVECLDMAFLRKGRIDLQFHIGVFKGEIGMKDIKEVFYLHLDGLVLSDTTTTTNDNNNNNNNNNKEKEIDEFLKAFIGKTASDIAAFCNKVKMYKLKQYINTKKNVKDIKKFKEVNLNELKELINF